MDITSILGFLIVASVLFGIFVLLMSFKNNKWKRIFYTLVIGNIIFFAWATYMLLSARNSDGMSQGLSLVSVVVISFPVGIIDIVVLLFLKSHK
jgi:ABC-type transport system involved in cytochrome c biogenesis permease component